MSLLCHFTFLKLLRLDELCLPLTDRRHSRFRPPRLRSRCHNSKGTRHLALFVPPPVATIPTSTSHENPSSSFPNADPSPNVDEAGQSHLDPHHHTQLSTGLGGRGGIATPTPARDFRNDIFPVSPNRQHRANWNDHQSQVSDEYELIDYPPVKAERQETEREVWRREKRAEKRRWLEEQDEMKFSHSIQFNAVPDWSSYYIAYSNLKKLYDIAYVTPY